MRLVHAFGTTKNRPPHTARAHDKEYFTLNQLSERYTCQEVCYTMYICFFLRKQFPIGAYATCVTWISHIRVYKTSSGQAYNISWNYMQWTVIFPMPAMFGSHSHENAAAKGVFGYFLSGSLLNCMVAVHVRPCTSDRSNVWSELHTCPKSPQGFCSLYYFFLFFYTPLTVPPFQRHHDIFTPN